MTRMFPRLQRALWFLLPPVVWWAWWPALAEPFQIKAHLAALGAALVLLMIGAAGRPAWSLPPALTLGWLGMLLAALLSIGHSAEPAVSALVAMGSLPLWCLIPSIRREQVTAVHAGLVWGGAGVALMVCLQYSGWDLGFQTHAKLAAYATLGNPNWVAVLLVTSLPLAMATRWRWGLLPLWLMALAFTQARQAWVAVVVMALLAIWRQLGSRLRWALMVGVAGLLVVAMGGLPQVHSVQGRGLIMAAAAHLTWEHPWGGVGLGMLDRHYPASQAWVLANPAWAGYADHAAAVYDAHNEWLQWAVTTGFPGLIALLCLTGATLWQGGCSAVVRQDDWHWYLAYVGMLVTWLATGVQNVPALVLLFALVQGVLGAALLNPARPLPGWSRPAALALGAMLLVGVAAWARQDIAAGLQEGKGDQALQERDAWLAREHYQAALALNPRRGALWKKLAGVEFLEGSPDHALAALTQAARYTGDPGVALLRGEILVKLGRDAEAIDTYQHLKAAYPHLITVHFVLGQLQAKQGDRAAAKSSLQQVIDIQPSPHNQQHSSAKVDQQKAAARRMLRQWP